MRKPKYKIFDLEVKRALEVIKIFDYLVDIGRCRFKYAEKLGITNIEWIKVQHFYLSKLSEKKDIIIEELKKRIL